MKWFRVCLGGFILFNLYQKSTLLQAFYTDEGVLPRTDLLDVLDPYALSIHFFSGGMGYQIFLLLLQAVFAVMFMFGYRTKISSIACWFLENSAQNRNPLVLDGGDGILTAALLWSIFLPLDEKRGKTDEKIPMICSWGTAGFMIQVCSIYIFSVILKIQSGMWLGDDGGGILFGLRHSLATPLAAMVAQLPKIMLWAMSAGTLLLELMAPVFYLAFGKKPRLRAGIVILFMMFHLGIGATVGIWRFSIICLILWLPLLPLSSASARVLSESKVQRSAVGFLIVLAALANLFSVGLFPHAVISKLHPVLAALNLHQNWGMFTAKTIHDTSIFGMESEGVDGSVTPLYVDGIVGKEQASRWLNYLSTLYHSHDQKRSEQMARYVCRQSGVKKVRIFRTSLNTGKKDEMADIECATKAN